MTQVVFSIMAEQIRCQRLILAGVAVKVIVYDR